MSLRVVKVVADKELRDLLRDRRTIISMVVIPVLTIPLLLAGVFWLTTHSLERMRGLETGVAVRGAGLDAGLLDSLRRQEGRFVFREVANPDLPVDSLLARGDTRVVLEFGPGLASALERLTRPDEEGPPPVVRLYYDTTDDEAKMAGSELRQRLLDLRNGRLEGWLRGQGLRHDLSTPWLVEHVETAPPKRQAADMLARFLPYIILILCIQGAMYPAMDLTAGEKERSTIETLLVNPVSRLDIVLGKYVATSVMALGSAVFTLGGQYVFFKVAANSFIEGGLPFSVEPSALGLGLLLLLPVALTFAAVLLAVCLYARSMKEAQSYLGPLMMLVIFPSMASMIPGLKLSIGLAFVPVFNVTILMKDALLQDYSQLGLMGLVFLINLGYAALSLWVAVKLFQREEVIFRS
ncbi:MAG: ABC transporter permease [bacterium]|jgi:sodium transport system permease protein|nr:ABC transporter permease [bacterium]